MTGLAAAMAERCGEPWMNGETCLLPKGHPHMVADRDSYEFWFGPAAPAAGGGADDVLAQIEKVAAGLEAEGNHLRSSPNRMPRALGEAQLLDDIARRLRQIRGDAA